MGRFDESTGARSRSRRASGPRRRRRSTGTSRGTRVLDDSRAPFYRWFTGGRLNTCYNALDRHVERGRADQPALIYDSPGHGHDAHLHLPRAAGRGRAVRRRARARRASSAATA